RALRRQAGVQRSVKIQIGSCWTVFEAVLSAQKNGSVSGNPVLSDTELPAKRLQDLACLLCPAARAGAGKDFMSVGSLLQAWIELDDTGKYGRLYFRLRGCPLLDAQRNTSQKVLNLTQHSHQIFLGSRLGLGAVVLNNFIQLFFHFISSSLYDQWGCRTGRHPHICSSHYLLFLPFSSDSAVYNSEDKHHNCQRNINIFCQRAEPARQRLFSALLEFFSDLLKAQDVVDGNCSQQRSERNDDDTDKIHPASHLRLLLQE